MKNVFDCSWIACLDESMMAWLQKWTCPGWMCVERKPHLFRNEWHTICCGCSNILFRMEIVEGKDCPFKLGPKNGKKMDPQLVYCCV